MAAEAITWSWREFVNLGLRRTTADDYRGPGETSAATTITLTCVCTLGSSPSATTFTLDFSET